MIEWTRIYNRTGEWTNVRQIHVLCKMPYTLLSIATEEHAFSHRIDFVYQAYKWVNEWMNEWVSEGLSPQVAPFRPFHIFASIFFSSFSSSNVITIWFDIIMAISTNMAMEMCHRDNASSLFGAYLPPLSLCLSISLFPFDSKHYRTGLL